MGYTNNNVKNFKKVISERCEAEYGGSKERGALLKKEYEGFIANRCENEWNLKNEIKNLINRRCSIQLLKNEEYVDLRNKLTDALISGELEECDALIEHMRIIVEVTTYKMAANDIYNIINT
jgi:hypothetical protein